MIKTSKQNRLQGFGHVAQADLHLALVLPQQGIGMLLYLGHNFNEYKYSNRLCLW